MWHCDFILTEDTGTGGTETTEERKTEAKRFLLALPPAKRQLRNPQECTVVSLTGAWRWRQGVPGGRS